MRIFSQSHGASLILILLQLICLTFAGGEENKGPVYIDELKVPNSVENGTEKVVTLDCNYGLANNDTNGLVVTWLLNSTVQIYQWIYGNSPQGLGIMRDRLDLNNDASKSDFKVHRALRIIRPTTELTGDYRCRVSSFAGSAFKDARMIVFVAAKSMELDIGPSSSPDSINVTCSASGVFPEPKLVLSYRSNSSKGERRFDQVETMSSLEADGAYEISVHTVIHESNLTLPTPTHFNCELIIPNTSYYVSRKFNYKGETEKNDTFVHPSDDGMEIPSSGAGSADEDSGEGGGSTLLHPYWVNGILLMLVLINSFGQQT